MANANISSAPVALPRVAITFCTQCRWMLRAAYFAQELISTFGNTIGEVALIPATGGLFQVHLTYQPSNDATEGESSIANPQQVLVWDRKTEGGFPETKILKQKVRNLIEPNKDLGHSDKHSKKTTTETNSDVQAAPASDSAAPGMSEKTADEQACEDCK